MPLIGKDIYFLVILSVDFFSYRKFTSQSHRATKTTYLVILILVFSYHLMIIIMHAAFCSEIKEKANIARD